MTNKVHPTYAGRTSVECPTCHAKLASESGHRIEAGNPHCRLILVGDGPQGITSGPVYWVGDR